MAPPLRSLKYPAEMSPGPDCFGDAGAVSIDLIAGIDRAVSLRLPRFRARRSRLVYAANFSNLPTAIGPTSITRACASRGGRSYLGSNYFAAAISASSQVGKQRIGCKHAHVFAVCHICRMNSTSVTPSKLLGSA